MEWMITRTGFHAEFFPHPSRACGGRARHLPPREGKETDCDQRESLEGATPVCSLVRKDNFCFGALLLAAYSSLCENTNTGLSQMGQPRASLFFRFLRLLEGIEHSGGGSLLHFPALHNGLELLAGHGFLVQQELHHLI